MSRFEKVAQKAAEKICESDKDECKCGHPRTWHGPPPLRQGCAGTQKHIDTGGESRCWCLAFELSEAWEEERIAEVAAIITSESAGEAALTVEDALAELQAADADKGVRIVITRYVGGATGYDLQRFHRHPDDTWRSLANASTLAEAVRDYKEKENNGTT